VRFTEYMPHRFLLNSISDNECYYFRYLDGNTPRIKFNVPDPGCYEPDAPIEVVKAVDIEIPTNYPVLPPANRDRLKPVSYYYNPEMDKETMTPIRIYTEPGVIEYGDKFLSYISPIQKFLTLHEYGHFFYIEEENCDLYALVNFCRSGYNQSTALYALSHILGRSKENIERIRSLFNNIQILRK